ncbi:unnamed protein product [Pleuronectes platessa]|uniref:Uncharacterized protein n=1 Tax=Pleuronectes platessa TaxID=8262 RepID=A0A9N7UTB8_PLEPL|nr:unnamed protein product [Pleuronectes platessa]
MAIRIRSAPFSPPAVVVSNVLRRHVNCGASEEGEGVGGKWTRVILAPMEPRVYELEEEEEEEEEYTFKWQPASYGGTDKGRRPTLHDVKPGRNEPDRPRPSKRPDVPVISSQSDSSSSATSCDLADNQRVSWRLVPLSSEAQPVDEEYKRGKCPDNDQQPPGVHYTSETGVRPCASGELERETARQEWH